jgi:hypothetical protein
MGGQVLGSCRRLHCHHLTRGRARIAGFYKHLLASSLFASTREAFAQQLVRHYQVRMATAAGRLQGTPAQTSLPLTSHPRLPGAPLLRKRRSASPAGTQPSLPALPPPLTVAHPAHARPSPRLPIFPPPPPPPAWQAKGLARESLFDIFDVEGPLAGTALTTLKLYAKALCMRERQFCEQYFRFALQVREEAPGMGPVPTR